VADSRATAALAFAPVVCQQEPATPFGESVDVNRSPTVWRPLHQAVVAETKEIGVEVAAATKGQTASNLTRVVPASVPKRFEHQALQFSALPHKAILPAFVSTFSFVTGTCAKTSRVRETAKACTLRRDSNEQVLLQLFPSFLVERFVSNAQKI
jgi:hypothetical protein